MDKEKNMSATLDAVRSAAVWKEMKEVLCESNKVILPFSTTPVDECVTVSGRTYTVAPKILRKDGTWEYFSEPTKIGGKCSLCRLSYSNDWTNVWYNGKHVKIDGLMIHNFIAHPEQEPSLNKQHAKIFLAAVEPAKSK
jgi:hypothetical protein